MSARLQVLLPESEMEEIRQFAEREHLSVGEWVRRSLREAREGKPVKSPESKLAAVRRAVEFNYPTGDIEQMIEEIERGYHE